MKTWRWFVGQVARLRRSIVGVFARGAERPGRADEQITTAGEPVAGPPEHWVERVRRGAPGLLEPSLRRRSEPVGAPAPQRAVPSQSDHEPRAGSPEEPERNAEPFAARVGRRPPERRAPVRPRLLRKVLRRERSLSPAEVGPPAPTADHNPRELHAAARRAGESAESPPRESPELWRLETPEPPTAESTDRHRLLDDDEPTRARPSSVRSSPLRPSPVRPTPPKTDVAERRTQPSEVVEFEAPAQRQTAHVELAASPGEPIRADGTRPRAASVRQAERAIDEIRPDRMWEPDVPSPTPNRESNVERLPEPAVPRPALQPEPERSGEPGPAPRRHAEPVAAIEKHPWPELPPPLDLVDTDVEAALRAWEHQRRIDHEQTRL